MIHMSRPTAIRSAASLVVIVVLTTAYLVWRSIAISAATDQLQNQMKTGAIGLIDNRFNGSDAQRAFIRDAVERTHIQAFERCEMEARFRPVGARGQPSGAEVAVNLQQYLRALQTVILSEARQNGIEIDEVELEKAMLVTQ